MGGIDDSRSISNIINENKEEINKQSKCIKLEYANEGSIVLYVTVQNILFKDGGLIDEILIFIQTVLDVVDVEYDNTDNKYLIITRDDGMLFYA